MVDKARLCDAFRSQVPFALPELLDHGTVEGVPYTIERRIPGRSLDLVRPELDPPRRDSALVAYADAAIALQSVAIEQPWIGEFLTDEKVRVGSWPEYLVTRATIQFERAAAHLRSEVPGVDDVFESFRTETAAVDGVRMGLVHGDYFPGNVMISDDLEITGVIDFGFSTLVGDPRLDLVGAICFVEVDRAWSTPDDAVVVRNHLERRAPALLEVFDLYRTYNALYWGFTHEFGLSIYDWCIRVLRDAADRPGGA